MQGSARVDIWNVQSDFGQKDVLFRRNPADSDSSQLLHPCENPSTMNTTSFK